MNNRFHSVKLIEEKCRGCTKCMTKCPVEAVRLKNSRAIIYADRCIDCGECIRVCPYNAHVAQKDNLSVLDGFKIKVVIPSVALYSQFGGFVNPGLINDAILDLGFDEIFDMTYACDIVSEIMKKELENTQKPAITPFCPAIVRLIQTSYPDLIEHVVKVLTPIEVSAAMIREKYTDMGFKNEEIGVFYLTPCVARITKHEHNGTEEYSRINGSIGISDIYPKLLRYINKNNGAKNQNDSSTSCTGLSWATMGGQSKSMNIKEYITVDGVENVIKLLDDIEKGKFKDVDFIETFACTEGCIGGLLLVENPFNARRIIGHYCERLNYTSLKGDMNELNKEQFITDYKNSKVFNQKFADDFSEAVKKMKYMNKLINILPGIDCGQCGSPSCKAFAEDVVRGLSAIEECRMIENGGSINED